MPQIKSFQSVNYKATGDSDRTRTGIAAVFGNIDSYGDITHPGSFTKTLQEGRQRVLHLWNHDASDFPTAEILEIKEIGRNELPAEILAQAPEATGGLQVKREYLKSQRGQDALELIDRGIITEMSFAYDAIKTDNSEIDGKSVRNIRELALYDTSDVPWGANPATLASLPKSLIKEMPLGWIVQQLQIFENEVKAGRRNSGSDQILINALHDISMSLGCNTCTPSTEETPKSEQAEAVYDTSLFAGRLKLQRLKSEILTAR